MNPGTLTLRRLRLTDEEAVTHADELMRAEGFDFLLDRQRETSFADYLQLLVQQREGLDDHPDRVPATFLVAAVDGNIVGRASLRHELNDFLVRYGGHIGFAVLPAFRRRGYATRILQDCLIHLAKLGNEAALLTCDDDNIGSRTVIERCSGVLEDRILRPDGAITRRYWISTR